MKFSRRGLLAGAAAVAATAGGIGLPIMGYQRYQAAEEAALVEEPTIVPPTLGQSLLAGRLVGIWDFRLLEGQQDFAELAGEGLELLLDVGPSGKALRGHLGRRPFTSGGFELFGELKVDKEPNLRWKLVGPQGRAYECTAIFDEVWGVWSTGGGEATLSGQLQLRGAQAGLSAVQARFVATRRPFIQARERLPYTAELHAWLISPGHRLYHQLWHATRDRWHRLDSDRHQSLRALGWQPGPLGQERDARGKQRHNNGSGEDFLYMHRGMLRHARSMQDLKSWQRFPPPRPFIGHGIEPFVKYLENHDGYSVPPAWESQGDDAFNQWLRDVKSSEGYYGNFQVWEAQFQDPQYLSTLCLGELGSRIELGLHDWLHMCWAAVGRDPNSGYPMIYDRPADDFSERWFRAENDYLADAFSSHVNPVFWAFHGWIDDRIEDWFYAHEQFHPGEVRRADIGGVPWFAKGRWVEIDAPWLGPAEAGCGAWGRSNGGGGSESELDIETMKLALHVIRASEKEMERLSGRIPRRPWYGQYLPPGPKA
ncbi:pyoverdine maturation tyrosinase PvdP [Pseudomonas sp. StFLB209]|uniref:pyoverdine maturation tyrosinase PvdP n=1 Tax=Pseudomonas sp. StFLB209 TaxID=1028989 RepID=UPI000A7E32B1|nr:PvdJ/PvdD/PvdP-like protein [Pseudomonas sp. StFLB209]